MGVRTPALEGVVSRREFWSGKRILLTGHTGFKGSWLALWLSSMGARVTGYALSPATDPSLWQLLGAVTGIRSVIDDVRDANALRRTVDETRPEIIFHMAAQSLVRKSYEDPVGTYATNVMGTVNMLEAARHCSDTRVVVNVTSDKCYENRETGQHYRESDPMGGHDPYSSSKGCAELVTAAYRRSFFGGSAGVASGRAGNVIGGGDWATDRLVPDLMRGALKGQSTLIRNPKAVRPWQHVLEPLAGYLRLAEQLWDAPDRFSGGWNFGPAAEDCVPVAEVADFVVKQWGKGASWTTDSQGHPHEAKLLALDAGKAHEQLAWKPRLRLPDALAWTVDWYRSVAAGQPARSVCLAQIERYEALQ